MRHATGGSSAPSGRGDRAARTISVPTRIVTDDVIADALEEGRPLLTVGSERYLRSLWDANPDLHRILSRAGSLDEVRSGVFDYLEATERAVFDLDNPLHVLEKATVRDAIRVFKSIVGPINEQRTEFSALDRLWRLAGERSDKVLPEVSVGFLMEFFHLFRAVAGRSGIYRENQGERRGLPRLFRLSGREAGIARSELLDHLARRVREHFARYPSGLDPEVIARRDANRRRILAYFEATEHDWRDHTWQIRNVIKTLDVVADLIELPAERRLAIRDATRARLPFGITPYYLSLMDRDPNLGFDHAVRAQVLPPPDYVAETLRHRADRGLRFDFMGEHDTSPVDLVTRRYPLICILKPYNTCAQICVYCQRNWEIEEVLAPDALAGTEVLDRAIRWIADHPMLGDVLITGGDPGVMADAVLGELMERIAAIDHVFRIRIGTRTPVVMPFRFTESYCDLLGRFHVPGEREVAVVTHVEHPYEVTPEMRDAVARIRLRGIGVYNQQVFTLENSRRFETARLRRELRRVGIDPYYTFNMKGKQETASYMVPIARLLQERKEEARLLPGLDRTDEPVFNVPRLGKNHLRALQDHRLVMILADGSRVYELHPWEKNIDPMPPYNYVDVPIFDYLEKLQARGEDLREYRTIWYYY